MRLGGSAPGQTRSQTGSLGSLVVDGANGDGNEVKILVRGKVPLQGRFLPHFEEKRANETMHLGRGLQFLIRLTGASGNRVLAVLGLVSTPRTDIATSHVRPGFATLMASNKGGTRRRASTLVAQRGCCSCADRPDRMAGEPNTLKPSRARIHSCNSGVPSMCANSSLV